FTLVLQEPEIGAELGRRFGESGQEIEHPAVDLAGIRLPGDGNGPGELERLCDPTVQLSHFLVVAVEQFEEARLRPGGPLAAPEGQRRYPLPERRGVEREILEPERGALPHRRELRGLEVGIGERRKPTMPE